MKSKAPDSSDASVEASVKDVMRLEGRIAPMMPLPQTADVNA